MKRCLGLPGEKIYIQNAEIFINERKLEPLFNVKHLYKVDINGFNSIADSLKLKYVLQNYDSEYRSARTELTNADVTRLKELDYAKHFSRINAVKGDAYMHNFKSWSIDDFGPILIPRKNLRIRITAYSYNLYNEIYNKFEKHTIYRTANGFFENSKPVFYYTFKHNYYFMMGDNRDNSDDSRYWGVLPEVLIKGKVHSVLVSLSNEGLHWDRILKAL